MKILSIETATMLGGIAIMDSELGLIAERRLNVKATHSERLMPELEGMLEVAGVKVDDLNAIAVSIGPGAFTGLRIGLGAAKGLAFSAALKLVPVPTLEALAWCMPMSNRPVCAMLDARSGQVYAGLYDTDDHEKKMPVPIIEAAAVNATAFARSLSDEGHDEVIFIGGGALVYRDDILGSYKGKAVFAPEHLMVSSPAAVASLGLRMIESGMSLPDPIPLGPMYMRKSEAELKKN